MPKEPLANLQSNSEEPFATHNEVCEETAPAEKAEQMQERLSQLTIQVPEPLMRFDEADAEDHERAEVEQMERDIMVVAANSRGEEDNNISPKPPLTPLFAAQFGATRTCC